MMIDTIFRVAAILVMVGVMVGAGQIAWWLGAAWFQSADVIPLSVQALDVSHGDKSEKEEGKHLATRLVKQIQRIQSIMSADLSNLGVVDQVRIESVAPKSLKLAPDVPVKIDIEVKAFDVDVVGIFERLYKFFDRSDRLEVSLWINDNIKLFGSLKTENKQRSIGPWWLDKLENEQVAVDRFAYVYTLDLYQTRVRGLAGLDPASFENFVGALDGYQEYLKRRHVNPEQDHAHLLKNVGELLQKIANDGKPAALVYSYLGSVWSLENDSDAAIAAYSRATMLDPDDGFAAHSLTRLRQAEALQPVPVATAPTGAILEKLRLQKLPGYDAAVPLPSHGDIVIAVIGTGISPELSNVLGARLVHSSSTVLNESDTDDQSGHGSAVISLVAALAPTAKIVSIKTFSREGTGSNYSIVKGILLAIDEGAKVILLPFGSPTPDEALESAVKDALNKGVLVVAPAGNTSADELLLPASITGVLAVGAVDTSDKLASFTNRGPNLLYAPGVDILVLGKGGILATQSGTSFSATVAAAIAAAVWAGRPDWTPSESGSCCWLPPLISARSIKRIPRSVNSGESMQLRHYTAQVKPCDRDLLNRD
jgi:hypothetical protein